MLQSRPDLVFDVGVYNGDDTAYYLSKGYHVLAVEADPSLITDLQARFTAEIARGQLQIMNAALAQTRGTMPFWICEGYRLWNSLDREHASRMGRKAHPVEIESWPLRDLLAQHGVPHYLKLSLHGAEHFCLADLSPGAAPAYISLELPRDAAQSDEVFARLGDLGYGAAKIIDQTTQKQFVLRPLSVKDLVRAVLRRHPLLPRASAKALRVGRRLLRVEKRQAVPSDPARPGHWVFPMGSSGPFGEETDGPWRTTAEAYSDWKSFVNDRWGRSHDLSSWHDLHVKRADPVGPESQ